MYLSRVELDMQRRDTMRAVRSPQIIHASVENCFTELIKTRKLWRIDSLRGKEYLLLLSREKPDFTNFISQFCAIETVGEVKNYNVLLNKLQAGQVWRFRLRGNTVHSAKPTDNQTRGKLYAHVTVSQRKEWLIKKSEACGFETDYDKFDVTRTDDIRFRRGQKYVSLGITEFEGVLKISDVEKFKDALTRGIGRAKAYGCGLLTVMKG